MPKEPKEKATFYDRDFYVWAQQVAEIVLKGRWDELDRENVADEIASLGRRDNRESYHRVSWVITELLRWWAQPELRCDKWKSRINQRRYCLEDVLKDSPTLRSRMPEYIADAWPMAAEWAVERDRLIRNPFPDTCPFTPEQILDADFWPEVIPGVDADTPQP